MKLRYLFSVWRMVKVPGLLSLIKDWQAFVRVHFLSSAFESGLLKAMVEPCDKNALLQKLSVKAPELLDALLDVGLACGELGRKNDLFFIKGKRSKAIINQQGDMLAAFVQANASYYSDAYRNIPNRIKGAPLGDDLQHIGDLVARASKIAEPIIDCFVSELVADKKQMRVLDIGCGSGFLLKSIYNKNSNANGVGLDIDTQVVSQAQNNMAAWNLTDRFEIFHGDIKNPPDQVKGPFDLINMYNLLYYFNDNDRPLLLKNIKNLLAPKGNLAIAMNFSSQGKDLGAANLNVVNCSLKGLTKLPDLDGTQSLLNQCGFDRLTVHRFMPGASFCGIIAGCS